jgi:hypothetical protein
MLIIEGFWNFSIKKISKKLRAIYGKAGFYRLCITNSGSDWGKASEKVKKLSDYRNRHLPSPPR